jgi:hypothetical protein
MPNETESSKLSDLDDANAAEGLTTLNISGHNVAGMSGVSEDYRRHGESGARWFFWVAGLSLINSIVILAEGRWNFLAGLGVTQVISALAVGLSEQLGGAVTVVAIVLDAIVAGIFVGLGIFAKKQNTWAFVVGMVVYALDGLIFLMVQDWLAIGFHAFVVWHVPRVGGEP